MHPEIGHIIPFAFPCCPADDLARLFSNEDFALRLMWKGGELLLYLGDHMRIAIAILEGAACGPCGEADGTDRFVVGGDYRSDREIRYHHLAGVNLPAACSMT